MHYYKRNLGDYAKKAGRLSMLQHGSYTLLIDACYDREQFPTLEEAIDWCWASSAAEVEAVEFVLRKFFVLEDGRYVQKRIQEEIDEYREKAAINARIAQERETKRRDSSTNRARVVNEPPPNQEPITNNHKPKKNTDAPPDGVSSAVWTDFVDLRKSKRAKLTDTAIDGIRREADKAGWTLDAALSECCARGWTGFKADWVAAKPARDPPRNKFSAAAATIFGNQPEVIDA